VLKKVGLFLPAGNNQFAAVNAKVKAACKRSADKSAPIFYLAAIINLLLLMQR